MTPWAKRLTKKERAHVRETTNGGLRTLAGFLHNRQHQRKHGPECHGCAAIARKLGLE